MCEKGWPICVKVVYEKSSISQAAYNKKCSEQLRKSLERQHFCIGGFDLNDNNGGFVSNDGMMGLTSAHLKFECEFYRNGATVSKSGFTEKLTLSTDHHHS